MKKVEVGFWGVDSILEFVKITTGYRHELTLVCGTCVVDAKSLLAILSLRMSQNAELVIAADSCESLLERLDPYIEHGKLLKRKTAVG